VDRKGVARRLGAAALLVLLLLGCSGGGGEAEQRSDSEEEQPDDDSRGAPGEDAGDDEAPPADVAPDGDAEAAARQSYVDYQTMFERLVIDPDSDDPEIEQRTSGDELNHVVDVLTRYETRGQAVEFGTRHTHNVFDVQLHTDGRTAVVLDCFVSDARVVDVSTRAVLSRDPEGGAANVVTATVVLADDAWTVGDTDAIPVQPGQACGPEGVIRGS
jgi:hypothetical protein